MFTKASARSATPMRRSPKLSPWWASWPSPPPSPRRNSCLHWRNSSQRYPPSTAPALILNSAPWSKTFWSGRRWSSAPRMCESTTSMNKSCSTWKTSRSQHSTWAETGASIKYAPASSTSATSPNVQIRLCRAWGELWQNASQSNQEAH